MIYFLMFISSIILIYLGNRLKNKNKIISSVCEIMGILLPCFLAAFRHISIGTDTDVYVIRLFNTALKDKNGFIHFYQNPYSNVSEILYLFVTYVCSRISSNIGVLFFVNEALVIIPIYIALKRINKNNINAISLGMFIFYTFFYNMSLNIARQSIAIAFTVLAFSYIGQKDKLKFLFFSFIAFLFHRTAIVLIPILGLYTFIESKKIDNLTKTNVKIIILFVLFIGIIFFKQILSGIIYMGVFSKYFSMILDKYVRNPIDFNQFNTIIYSILYMVIYINRKFLDKEIYNFSFYKYISLLSIFILQLGGIVRFSDRIGHYILFPAIFILIPKIMPESLEKIKNRKAFCTITTIIVAFCIYWVFWILIQNVHETYPYLYR